MGEGLYDTRFRACPKPKTKQTTAIRNRRAFSNYRILTPRLPALHAPHGDFFPPANYPFSTPPF
jgi:hypothetical protein